MSSSTSPSPVEALNSLLLSRPLSRSVTATTALLKRLYILERGCMRALAGWLPAIETQEIKLLTARHLYLDALTANDLRERIQQLRYPRRDVDRGWDPQLVALQQSATQAPDEGSFIAGLYRVLKPAMLAAYQQAEAACEPVGDSPTRLILQQIQATRQMQQKEMLPALASLESRSPGSSERIRRWEQYLQALLSAAGGVSGQDEPRELPVDRSLERPFERPTAARRDPRYQRRCELMTHHPLFWVADDPGLHWLSYAIGHLNELWAAEATCALIYQYPDAPWNLLLDAARWCADEARHCQMGITRLERAGLDLFQDVPAPDTVTYDCFEPDHLKERLLAIHCFERGGVVGGGKQAGMKWHQQMGDEEGSRHYDFDWADESIHLRYGLDWLKHLYGEEIMDRDFDARLEKAVAHRTGFFHELAAAEKPLVEANFRHLCARLNIPFQTQPVDHYIGRE
jgi:hypothetical protein